jgi:hypothetical protein
MQIDISFARWWAAGGSERRVVYKTKHNRKEATGHIRWLQPGFLNASVAVDGQKQQKIALPDNAPASAALPDTKHLWPATLPEPVAALTRMLAVQRMASNKAEIAEAFIGKSAWQKRLPQLGRFGASK